MPSEKKKKNLHVSVAHRMVGFHYLILCYSGYLMKSFCLGMFFRLLVYQCPPKSLKFTYHTRKTFL